MHSSGRIRHEELARMISDSRLVVHKNAGYMLYCEDPEGVASYIATFIEEIQSVNHHKKQ
jgi:hypothetical protein